MSGYGYHFQCMIDTYETLLWELTIMYVDVLIHIKPTSYHT